MRVEREKNKSNKRTKKKGRKYLTFFSNPEWGWGNKKGKKTCINGGFYNWRSNLYRYI